jgi:competence protein ComEC
VVHLGAGLFTIGLVAGQLVDAVVVRVPALSLLAALSAVAAVVARRALGVEARATRALTGTASMLAGVMLGAAYLAGVTRVPDDAAHVARLELPLATVLEGEVVEAPVPTRERVVVVLEARAVGSGPARRAVRGRVRLTIRQPPVGSPMRLPGLGDTARMPTTLRRPRGFRNPGSFDTAGHLARRRIWVTASVWDAHSVRWTAAARVGVRGVIERWRAQVRAAIDAALATTPARAGLLRALVVGEQGTLDPALAEAFRRTGVNHVLSVSGLHVALVATASVALFAWLLARSTWLVLRVDVRAMALLLALGPVALYVTLAGLGTAALRAAVMAAVGAVALALGRRVALARSLALAAVVVALAYPGSPREAGCQLSFVAVLALAIAARAPESRGASSVRRWTRAALRVALSAWVGTAPLVAYHFQSLSLVAPVVNPLVTPLLGGLVVVPGLVGACLVGVAPALAKASFQLAGLLAAPGLAMVEEAGRWPWAAMEVPRPSPVELVLLYVLLAGFVFARRPWAAIVVSLAIVALAADVGWWAWLRAAPGRLRVTFLDVGQGDAAVAELPDGRVLVVDAGGFPGGSFDPGAAVVRPFLRTRKILRVEALVMTHPHPDHAAGLASLVGSAFPRELWWAGGAGRGLWWDALEAALDDAALPRRRLEAGSVAPGGVDVLHPPAGWPSQPPNDASLTLRLAFGEVAILLAGDVEAKAEREMLAARRLARATVVKVPHHGGRTSSTRGFVATVAPAIAVVSVGAENRYGHPAPEVEARYRDAGTCWLCTDRCGAITLETDGRTLDVRSEAGCGCASERDPRGFTPPA